MGVSHPAIRLEVLKSFQQHDFKSCLDLGCGIGEYAVDMRKYFGKGVLLYGIDGYFPYLCKDNCRKYDVTINADVFDFVEQRINIPVDCVLCMDVLEHFPREKALVLSAWLLAQPFAFMSTPLFDFPQGIVEGNGLERHQCWFERSELEKLGWLPLAGIEFPEAGTGNWIGGFKNHA
jgi:hypothetical protein